MQKSLKKVTFTALSIIPKDTAHIQTLRKQHDPAFQRWPPHINICFPFVDPSDFDRVHPILQQHLSTISPFLITFDKIDCFRNKTAVIFAQPDTKDHNIEKIFDEVFKCFPELDDGVKKSESGKFHAHLTLGKVPQKDAQKTCKAFQESWKPVSYLCDEIYFLQRGKDTPMEVVRSIKLVGKPDE